MSLTAAQSALFMVVRAESLAAGLTTILGGTLAESLTMSLGVTLSVQSPETRLGWPGADS